MSRFRFTPEMFSMGGALDNDDAAIQANAALDEYLKGLVRVYGDKDNPDSMFVFADGYPCEDDTHTALLFNVEELKTKKCLHSSLRTRHDGKLDCAECGKVLEYKLVEV